MNTPQPIIQTRGLKRTFKQVTAVDGVNLSVAAGSIYGFLGPNGAGKTTTIRMLLGLIRPTSGQVEIFGQALEQHRAELLPRIGALVETPSFYPHLTGRENLELIAGMRRLGPKEVQRALAIVDLEKDAGRLVRHYSLGMGQRLGLAIALLGGPGLLVLDEPTNGLDPSGIHEIRELIRRLPGEYGITVFVSSHLLNEVEQMANDIGIIQAGQLLFQGRAAKLRAEYADTARLITDRPDAASEILTRLGWKVALEQGSDAVTVLNVEINGQPDVALIVQHLVTAGIHIYHASQSQPSLEEIFLKLTQTTPRPARCAQLYRDEPEVTSLPIAG